MTQRNFNALVQAQADQGKFVCIGLDPDLARLPDCVRARDICKTIFGFNKAIIDSTHDVVAAYKPNTAFYEAHGPAGWSALEETTSYILEMSPRVAIIGDGKRGDIGNSNNGSATMAFDRLEADALTVNPYLGATAMPPFLDRVDKGIIVLCRTSNPGSGEFQELVVQVPEDAWTLISNERRTKDPKFNMPHKMPLYQYVAYRAASEATGWNKNGNCALVVGATYPEQMQIVRDIVGDDMLILAPGIGKQGGDLQATVVAAKNSRGQGFLINSSSDIIFGSNGSDFDAVARQRACKLSESIRQHL